ncbi:MAG: hypothetical protein AAF492_13260, partial [Verrucomicrobiota bacterium]
MASLLLVFGMSGALQGQSLDRKTIKKIKDATVFLRVTHQSPLGDESFSSSGTGFFISPHGHLVTSYHVVQPIVSSRVVSFPAPVKSLEIIRHSGT